MTMATTSALKKSPSPSPREIPALVSTSHSKPPIEEAPIATETKVVYLKQKKKKRHSPFRVKVGCIAALRFRAGGNTLKRISPTGEEFQCLNEASYSEVWTDPLPGRDEGLALIGRRVRCCFPKSVLSSASSRIVEGEIVSLPDYESLWLLQRQRRRRRESSFTPVELLVDRQVLQSMPFLDRIDQDVDITTMSSKEKRLHGFERQIQGKDTIIVKINLADTSRITVAREKSDESKDLVAKWVIRKRIKLLSTNQSKSESDESDVTRSKGDDNTGDGKKSQQKKNKSCKGPSATLYLGDGHDPEQQQERNWRWLGGRYDDMMLGIGESSVDNLSFGLVGEVVAMSLAPASVNGSASSSLAAVTLRRLILPEHVVSGRLSYHGSTELFDDADTSNGLSDNGKNEANGLNALCTFQVPVEELVVISRKFERRYHCMASASNGSGVHNGLSCPVITRSYSSRSDVYRTLAHSSGENGNDMADCEVCYRCRMMLDKHLLGDTEDEKSICQNCQKATEMSKRFGGASPCDSRECTLGSDSQETVFKFQVENILGALQGESGGSKDKETYEVGTDICVVCGFRCTSETRCGSCEAAMHKKCAKWDGQLGSGKPQNGSHYAFSKSAHVFCRLCRFGESGPTDESIFENETMALVGSAIPALRPTDFELPSRFMDFKSLPAPCEKPVTLTKARRGRTASAKKTPRKGQAPGTREQKAPEQKQPSDLHPAKEATVQEPSEGTVFALSCSRLTPYDPSRKSFSGTPKQQKRVDESRASSPVPAKTSPRRDDAGRPSSAKPPSRKRARERERATEHKTSTSRAARASQRRMMKGVAALGASGLELDALAGREQQLRFDRSSIHAWGVFADEDINAGDMIVEYRGELIGNAVAEKREIEYEKAKIGSDYMFRVDGSLVCDATKQGNVARFINASCDPNCYTQIITLSGNKRIVIYAKKDIKGGEELCYDYKFPLEYDESKRIPCHCGAQNCRGYMNWDKRYVALPQNQLGDVEANEATGESS